MYYMIYLILLNTQKNRHYSLILRGCINIRKGKAKFNNFQILLDIRCISTIVMGRIVEKLNPKKDAVM